jgi:hypothetical protein
VPKDTLKMTDEWDTSWPEKGDKLFISDPNSWHNAHIYYRGDDWHQYITGYKRAGDILITHAKDTMSNQDYIVLPVVFLYRQYLELQLKQLIRDGRALLDQSPEFPKTHDLGKLWNECSQVLSQVFLEDTDDETSTEIRDDSLAIRECIEQFASIDPTSMAFRYPVGKEGEVLLPDDARVINLSNLADVINKIANYLDGAATGISVYLDTKQEMEEYYAGYSEEW